MALKDLSFSFKLGIKQHVVGADFVDEAAFSPPTFNLEDVYILIKFIHVHVWFISSLYV